MMFHEDAFDFGGLVGRIGDAVVAEELDAVPHDGVVGGGDDDGGGGFEETAHEGDGGSGDDAEVDDIDADGEEAGGDGGEDHGAGRSGVAADGDGGTLAGCQLPIADFEEVAEGLAEFGGDVGGEGVADEAADAGDADHEDGGGGHGWGYSRKLEVGSRKLEAKFRGIITGGGRGGELRINGGQTSISEFRVQSRGLTRGRGAW